MKRKILFYFFYFLEYYYGVKHMEYITFYASVIIVWIVFGISTYLRPLNFKNVVIGITTVGYSLSFDTLFGTYMGLYNYINIKESPLYIILSAIFIYPMLNMVYTMFLPDKKRAAFIYTGLWIAAMLLFEYLTLLSGTIILTGWRPMPWSIVTYVTTYLWIYFLYRNLVQKFEVNIRSLQ